MLYLSQFEFPDADEEFDYILKQKKRPFLKQKSLWIGGCACAMMYGMPFLTASTMR